jgi:hypothetical protein
MSESSARILLAAAALALAAPGHAQAPGATALALQVGERAPVGPAPVRNVICDDPSVVRLVDTPAGPAFQGLAPGATTCSLVDAASVRRVYRVKVVAAPPPSGPSPGSP